jgi:hypothetical protein
MDSEKDTPQNEKEEQIIETKIEDNNVFKEYSEKSIPIHVNNPIKRDGLKSYVVYTVIVERKPDPVYRRYSDFYELREKLMERWPGVYIPNIPPKKVVVWFR